jgi:hypothetical protein
MPTRTIHLSDDLALATEHAAAREGVSVSEFVRRAITERVDRASGSPADWERYVGCGSRSAITAERAATGEFARSVEAKFARIERQRHCRR